MQTLHLVCVGVLVHLVFFYSIFDIYFTSPLVHGMQSYHASVPPPAKRLVLFVTDGLRADKFFSLDDEGKSRAPYLRSIIENYGTWGVSHTRVPTESRPGHVALIAGFYEDVSAVAKGWKENPVEFDSVFNQSQFTWSWGSPDILPMFAKGASGNHVFMDYYPSENEDFAASDASKLDTWVFDKVKNFIWEANKSESLSSMLKKEKIIFFLHLLGLDTNGHSHKPYSSDYLQNIGLVDRGINDIVNLFEDFYSHDGSTAYIMTADHGMTDWGSHGAGHASETQTPLVVWGAGVRGPLSGNHSRHLYQDSFSKDWRLEKVARTDVKQADIAPLMAALTGLAFPLNSVGTLPIDILSSSTAEKAAMLFSNALQILAQFKVKMKEKQSTTLTFLFRPYSHLTEDKQIFITRNIKTLMKSGLHHDAIEESYRLIDLSLQGLHYYQTYDRFYLGMSICSGYLGWMSYILTLILREHCGIATDINALDKLGTPRILSDVYVNIMSTLAFILIIILLAVQSLPWSNYIYCTLPLVLWAVVIKRWFVVYRTWRKLLASNTTEVIQAVVLCVAALEILVAGFFYRELLSVGLVCMGLWPLATGMSRINCKQKKTQYGWCISCLLLSVFPVLPVVGRDIDYNLVILAGVMGVVCSLIIIPKLKKSLKIERRNEGQGSMGYIMQVLLMLVAIINVYTTSKSIKSTEGLPGKNQIISWIILGVSFPLPLFSSTAMLPRLFSIVLSFTPTYLLLSISHEGLFVLCLCVVMYFWLRMENEMNIQRKRELEIASFLQESTLENRQRDLVLGDIRRALFYIFFILTAFFGTGNIASINSFEPASVYCFLTVFNPFVMGALMMLKNVIPLILVSCTFTAVRVTSQLPTRALFLLVLLMSDLMAINFFFLVKDYGSWLEIGTSISHYVIVMCMNIFLMLLFVLSNILTSKSISLQYKSSYS